MRTLRDINLNLLPVLHALVHHRNVTRAGEALNMSQSAVSDALAQLRHEFDDPLLVRSGREMLLTDMARSLIPQIDETLAHVQRLLGGPAFDPAELDRNFVIATADSAVMTLGPPLAARLEEEAPKASVHFIDPRGEMQGELARGVIDLIVAPEHIGERLGDVRQAILYEDEFVCILRKGHPLGRKRLTKEAYWAATHVTFRPGEGTFESQLVRKEGGEQFDRICVSQFALLPAFVERSDAIALLPRRVAERMAGATDIQIAKPPLASERVPLCMFWNEIKHNDPAHRWLRELLIDLRVD